MPAVGYRVAQDNSALLSPSFDEPLIALQTISTQKRGWEDFMLDLSEFAENWGGTPLFNQTPSTRDAYVAQTYGGRMEFFKKIRRQLDPDDRLVQDTCRVEPRIEEPVEVLTGHVLVGVEEI